MSEHTVVVIGHSTLLVTVSGASRASCRGSRLDVHLRARARLGVTETALETADVLVAEQPCRPRDLTELCRTYPGAAVVAGCSPAGGYVVALRHGRRLRLLVVQVRQRTSLSGCAAVASALHAMTSLSQGS